MIKKRGGEELDIQGVFEEGKLASNLHNWLNDSLVVVLSCFETS